MENVVARYRRVMLGKFTADALCGYAWRPPCSPMGRLASPSAPAPPWSTWPSLSRAVHERMYPPAFPGFGWFWCVVDTRNRTDWRFELDSVAADKRTITHNAWLRREPSGYLATWLEHVQR